MDGEVSGIRGFAVFVSCKVALPIVARLSDGSESRATMDGGWRLSRLGEPCDEGAVWLLWGLDSNDFWRAASFL